MKQIRVSKKEGEPEIGKKLKKILAALKEKGNWGFLGLFLYFFRRFLFYFSSVLFGDIFSFKIRMELLMRIYLIFLFQMNICMFFNINSGLIFILNFWFKLLEKVNFYI